jgi:hypothetical protein
MNRMLYVAVALVGANGFAHAASPTPIDAFARTPHIRNVSISPSGNKLAFVSGGGERYAAVTVDLTGTAPPHGILSDNDEFELQWCNWANDKRLLCGFRGMAKQSGIVYPVTRLVAINDDGSSMKVMIQNSEAGVAQFQDQILDWTPDEPDSVLIELDDDRNGYPSVFELDVNNGRRALRVRERSPIRSFRTDSRGNVRIGSGYDTSGQIHYFARLENERDWQRLAKIKAFAREDELLPIAIAPGTNRAFALGNYAGRSALWEMDLNDQKEPRARVLACAGRRRDADPRLRRPAAGHLVRARSAVCALHGRCDARADAGRQQSDAGQLQFRRRFQSRREEARHPLDQ